MALTGETQAWRSKPARVIWAACLGTAIAPAGIQGIAPAIPAIQDQYGLSVAQVSLITSVFLLPSIFSAFGAGVLADGSVSVTCLQDRWCGSVQAAWFSCSSTA